MDESLASRLLQRSAVAASMLERAAGSEEPWLLALVREGVDADVLADELAAYHGVARALRQDLESADADVFQRIPIEILRDAGLLPLRASGRERLLVGVVDPGESARIEEAEFFAGVALELRVISVLEMARIFERLSGAPWRIGVDEVVAAGPGPVSGPTATGSSASTRAVAPHSAPQPSVNERRVTRVEVLPADGEADFELTPALRKKTTGQHPTLPPRSPSPVSASLAVELRQELGTPPPVAGAEADRLLARERPLRRAAERRPRTTTGNQAVVLEGAWEDLPNDGRLGTVPDVITSLGPAELVTEAAFRCAIEGVAEATNRDEIAQQVVDALCCVYPNVVLLSLRRPYAVVWGAGTEHGGPRLAGVRFELTIGSLWASVAEKGMAYAGPLPGADPLRRLLGRGAGSRCFVVPVVLNRRPVAMLALGASPDRGLPLPGESAEALPRAVARAFKRLILRTKREPHVV